MLFTTKWLAELFPDFQGEVNDYTEVDEITTDSRKEGSNTLFIPIVGENFDAHDFAKQAINNGAVAILWNKNKKKPDFTAEDFPIFFVNDTLKALQDLAVKYHQDVNPITIGITGSNGKTTTKDLTAAIVQTSYRTHYTKGNFNNHIGLPLTILSMDRDTEVLILEMGMSNFGEIDLLSRIAKPDYAIITNIGESHIEFLGSREGIAKAKLEIVNGLKDEGILIIDGDEPLLNNLPIQNKIVKNGFGKNNDTIISNVVIKPEGTEFNLSDGFTYFVPLFGSHHAKNASFALTIGRMLNISAETCVQAIKSLALTGMRFEILKGRNDVTIINDAYNASPTSMKASIEVVKQMNGFKEKVLILGDVLELGNHSKRLHQSIAESIDPPITAIFTFGKDAEFITKAVKEKENGITCIHFPSKQKLEEALEPYLKKETLLLFKASRGLKFETMIEAIQ